MEFEYSAFNDYLKIIEPIEKYDLRAECIAKLKELGIHRVGEILACSDLAISDFGDNAELVEEAKIYFESVCGELNIWELIWEFEEFEEKDKEKYEAFSLVDEDDPLDILYAIVGETLIGYLYEYKKEHGKGLKVSDTTLPQDIKDKFAGDENALIMFFILSANEIATSTLNYEEIDQVRQYLLDLFSMPKEIFSILDELGEKREKKHQRLLEEKGYKFK